MFFAAFIFTSIDMRQIGVREEAAVNGVVDKSLAVEGLAFL